MSARNSLNFLKRICILLTIFITVLLASGVLLWMWLGFENIPCLVKTYDDVKEVDYIIIGAGTAGSVLANKLTMNSNYSVLLIEAGAKFGPLSIVPLASTIMQGSNVDWSFKTAPQKFSSKGLYDRKQAIPRGRGLGGSSQINYMLHFSGIKKDFDKWVELGAHEWSYANMKKYLNNNHEIAQGNDVLCETTNKSNYPVPIESDGNLQYCEYSEAPNILMSPKHHITEIIANESILGDTFLKSQNEILKEHELNIKYNLAKYTIKNGVRWSVYHEYLRPIFRRNNFQLMTNTFVHKINFSNQKHAYSVTISPDWDFGELTEIHARKEIILSAGALQTPQILKLSGVGDRKELDYHDIQTVHHSPNVGRNLYDHMNMPLFVSINETASVTLNKILSVSEIYKYIRFGEGILSNTAVYGLGRVNNDDYGVILFGMGSADETALRAVANFKSSTFRSYFPFHYNSSQEGFIFISTCLQPKSRGFINLKDAKISTAPIIDPNYLEEEYDVECMKRAIRLIGKTIATEPFRKLDAQIHWPKLKECVEFGPFVEDFQTNRPSDDYLDCLLSVGALTGHHPGGTAAIGNTTESVVNNYLKVQGVRGLRVVDASVLPSPISGTPNSVIKSVAERAADLILNKKQFT